MIRSFQALRNLISAASVVYLLGALAAPGLPVQAAPPAGATPIAVGGRVLAAGGGPLADAEVLLVASLDPYQRVKMSDAAAPLKPVARGVTDSQGRFRLEAPTAGLYFVRVQASGFVPIEMALEPLIEPADLPDAEISGDVGLTVKVTDKSGQPLAGARVRLDSSASASAPRFMRSVGWEPALQIAVADANGIVRLLRSEKSSVALTAFSPGYLTSENRSVRGTAAVLSLKPGTTVPVSVLSADKTPAPGVLVIDADRNQPMGFTNDQGRFDVAVPASGALAVRLMASDGRRADGRVTLPKDDAAAKGRGKPGAEAAASAGARVLTLPARFEVKGRVIDAKDRKPIAGAVVWPNEQIWGAAVTDAAGQYLLRGTAGQEMNLMAGAPGYLQPDGRDYSLSANPGPGPTIALLPGAAIEGIVLDEGGQPVAGAEAALSVKEPEGRMMIRIGAEAPAPHAVSSPRGTFRISPVDPKDNYELKVKASGFASSTREIVGLEARRTMSGVKVEMSRGQAVTGTVTDAEGRAIRDASVSLRSARKRPSSGMMIMDMGGGAPVVLKAATDAQGRFRVSGVAAGTFDLDVEKSGFAKKSVAGIDVAKKPEPIDVGSLVLDRGVRVSGLVSSPDGAPIEGVELRLAPASGGGPMMMIGGGRGPQQPPSAVTGPDGRFTIADLKSGDPISLSLSRTGYVAKTESGVQVPRSDPLMVTLQPASKVSGRVVGPDKKPVANAQVSLTRTQTSGIGGQVMKMIMRDGATADAEGFFIFKDLRPGQITLSAVASGWQEAKLDGIEIPEGQDVTDIELPLKPGSVVVGRVLAPDGKPVIGARIDPVTDSPEPIRMGGVSSDGDGNYRLEGLVPGEVSIEATHDDYVRTVKQVDAKPGTNKLDLQFEGGQDISGMVSDDSGKPVAGAQIMLTATGRDWGGPETKSGADGTFKMSGVGDGEYSLSASRDGYAPSAGDAKVHVAGNPVAGLKIVLGAGGVITGTVTGLSPDEMPKVEIRAYNTDGMGSAAPVVDRQGKFRMEHLPPGTWTVLGSIPDTGRQAREKAVLDPAVSETTIELQFGGGLTLTGRALLGEDPVKGATLFAQGTDVNHSSWGRTGADGTFRMEGLEAGTYRVELQQFDTGLSYGETVEVKTDRDVTLKVPTAKIIGRIVDSADNRPVAGVSVVLQGREGSDTGRTLLPRGATSDLTGRFEVANVTNGSWTLKADKSGYAAGTADVDVDNGHAPDNTRISLDPTDGVALEVKLPSGRVPDTIDAAVLDSSGRVLTGGSYATGENGRVRLTSIPPGSWDVVVSAAGSGTVNVRVNVPGQTVVVPLPPACALSLSVPALAGSTAAATATITGSDGKTFRSLGWMADTMSQWRLSNGKVEVDALPPGNWTLQVAASDGRTWSGSSSTQPDRAAQVVLQ